jgi:hypothetical protein
LRKLLVLLVCVEPACFQDLNENAAKGDPNAQGPALDTPPIDLPNGDQTNDACMATTWRATDILRRDCAQCHGGQDDGARRGQPPFDYVLDFQRMTTARSATVPDPRAPSQGMLFIVPGDPEDSRVYQRIANGEMPPTLPVGLDPLPRPNISEISLLYTWISNCMGAAPATGGSPDAGSPDAGSPDAGTTDGG